MSITQARGLNNLTKDIADVRARALHKRDEIWYLTNENVS